jgi:hypothetical protein
MLTEGSDWPERQRRVAGGGVRAAWMGQRSWRGLMQGVSGLLDSMVQLVKLLRRCYGGQEGRGATGGEESRVWSNSPAAVLGAIPALHGSGSRVASLVSFLAVRRS